MTDTPPDVTARPPAPSPCTGVCRLDEDDRHCVGCLRTLGEIAHWSRLDEDARHDLLDELAQRRSGGGIE